MSSVWESASANCREFGRVFAYPHIPSGFIARLLVRILHLQDVIGEAFWSHGLLLRFDMKGKGSKTNQLGLVWLDDSSSKLFIRCRVTGPPTVATEGLLLRRLLNSIDTMNECYYNLGDLVEQTIPCTHCIGAGGNDMREPFYFTYAECVTAITAPLYEAR